jgi:hypothetical protein
MGRVTGSIRQIWRETRGNFFVEGLKYIAGATLLKSIGSAISRLFTHAPLYWYFLFAEFCVGLSALTGAIWLQRERRRPSASKDHIPIAGQMVEAANPQGTLPHAVFFSPLQIEAMQIARGLREVLANVGPAPVFVVQPDNQDQLDLQDRLTRWNRLLREWSSKIDANYKLYFAKQTENLRLKINAMVMEKPIQIETDLWSLETIPSRGVKSGEDLEKIIEALQRLFMFLDGQNGESPLPRRAESA